MGVRMSDRFEIFAMLFAHAKTKQNLTLLKQYENIFLFLIACPAFSPRNVGQEDMFKGEVGGLNTLSELE